MLTRDDADKTKLEVPPAMDDRYIIRNTGAKFGNSSKGNPMITTNWEIAGILVNGVVQTEIVRNGVTYQVAGLPTQPKFFTLTSKAVGMYLDVLEGWGCPVTVDETNPDLTILDNMVCSALLRSKEFIERKVPTEDQEVGDPILDDDGKPMVRNQVQIMSFGRRYMGELPTPY